MKVTVMKKVEIAVGAGDILVLSTGGRRLIVEDNIRKQFLAIHPDTYRVAHVENTLESLVEFYNDDDCTGRRIVDVIKKEEN